MDNECDCQHGSALEVIDGGADQPQFEDAVGIAFDALIQAEGAITRVMPDNAQAYLDLAQVATDLAGVLR